MLKLVLKRDRERERTAITRLLRAYTFTAALALNTLFTYLCVMLLLAADGSERVRQVPPLAHCSALYKLHVAVLIGICGIVVKQTQLDVI